MNEVEFTHAKEAAKVADILGETSLAGAPRAYKPTAGFAVAVLALFFIGQSAFVINPAMDGLYAQFDSLPISTVSLISTMVSLAMVPSSLMAGALAGKRVSYRTLAVVGAACVAFGGAAAYLLSERFVLLVVSRFFVGFGIGLTMPLGSALIMQAYSGHKSALMNGLAMAINNIAGIFFQISSGVLVMQGVKYCWLLYLAVLVPLVLALVCIRDPGEAPKVVSSVPAKEKLPTHVWTFCLAGMASFACISCEMLQMSTLVVSQGWGDAALSGLIVSFMSVGGLVAGLIFGLVYRRFGRRWTIPVALGLISLAILFAAAAPSVVFLFVSALMLGMGMSILYPAVIQDFGETTGPANVAFATGLWVALYNGGGFLSTPLIAVVTGVFASSEPRLILGVAGVLMVVISVIWTTGMSRLSRKA